LISILVCIKSNTGFDTRVLIVKCLINLYFLLIKKLLS
jgi:hypothetical protein